MNMLPTNPNMLPTPERVLSTLNQDGSRRWIDPKSSPGRFLTRRRAIGWALIALFAALPFVRIGGKPALFFDLMSREFTFFGTTFFATETLLLALLVVGIFLGIFWVTALLGRVWCGYACPQTVYLELVYRPLQRLIEGKHGRHGAPAWRRVLRFVVYLALSFVIANVFLAYFVGVDRLSHWVTTSPAQHPAAFAIVAVTTLAMFIDFAYVREQMCTLMCPYGRLQSVLLDEHSLVIGYDAARGEPRGKLESGPTRTHGDCIDCKLCVQTCPTGIDIRGGLQMECVGCAQCIDACDAVMDKIERPRGLIRYATQATLAGKAKKTLRPRVVLYPLLIAIVLSGLVVALARRSPLAVEFLRTRGAQFTVLADGSISSPATIRLENREDGAVDIVLAPEAGVTVLGADGPQRIGGRGYVEINATLVVPRERFENGRAQIRVRAMRDGQLVVDAEHTVLGPLFGGSPEKKP
ncbi:MAG: cytochrome c oxidase accessory protein CcoG [Planctomycetes bacterium]|nr:cytochrome c oxidase accessory protein CcoG [Planctomycetota bacterium]